MKHELFMKEINGDKVYCLEYDKETLKDMVISKQEEIERLNEYIKELKNSIKEAKIQLYKRILENESALTNKEETIISKHDLLKLEITNDTLVLEMLGKGV